MEGVQDLVHKGLTRQESPTELRTRLLNKGFLADDVDSALNKELQHPEDRKKIRLFAAKEIIDRIGYGITSPQYINILFFFAGASFFLVGLVNGLKTIITDIISSLMREYHQKKQISVDVISLGGIIFGFSFIFLSLGVVLRSPIFFMISLLMGSIGVVTHGDSFQQFTKQQLKKEKMPWFLAHISLLGLIFIAIGLFIGGYVMDMIPLQGKLFSMNLFGMVSQFKAYGYLISFEVTAILFILSGYLLSYMKKPAQPSKKTKVLKNYFMKTRDEAKIWTKNKLTILATSATLLIIVGQIIVNSFYGIFIWQNFRNVGIGGFTNVAIIFIIALFAAMIGPYITRSVQLKIGEGPMLVFGTLLVAMLPLTIYSNANLLAIGFSTAISIIGAALLGTAQGLFMRKLLPKEELSKYFSSLGVVSIIPILILVPIAAWLTQMLGIQMVMLFAGLLIACIAMPLYFIIVVLTRKFNVMDYFIDVPNRKKTLTLADLEKQVAA